MKKPLIGALLILSMVAPASFVSALTANYTYDAAGRLTGAEYDIGSSITYAYDANGNLTFVWRGQESVVALAYDPLNRCTQMVDAVGTTRCGSQHSPPRCSPRCTGSGSG